MRVLYILLSPVSNETLRVCEGFAYRFKLCDFTGASLVLCTDTSFITGNNSLDGVGGIDIIRGGSFDINRQAYLGGGYEYRQYTMGSFTLLGINRVGDTKNTIYLKDWADGRFGISLSGQEQETEKPQSSPISVESLAGNDVDFILGKDAADGGQGNDFLQGTAAQSVLSGGIGNDVINGMGGDDWLEGGDGNDYIGTGQGSDVAYGGAGHDVLTAYGTLSTDVCARQPSDLLTTQRFYYKTVVSGECRSV